MTVQQIGDDAKPPGGISGARRARAGEVLRPPHVTAATRPVVQATDLTKRYGSTIALDRLNLLVEAGEVYGFLGPNGAGKTTTIRLLLGLHRATSGKAELFGADAFKNSVPAHRRLAYVSGEPALWPSLTGFETLELLGGLHGGVDTEYRAVLIDRFQFDAGKKVRELSKGNRQKLQLIAALATRAELLLLDEPTSGLDPLMAVAFRESIIEAKDRGQTVFLSSHILSEVEALCDRVGILRGGRLVDQGTLAELRHLTAQTFDVTFAGQAPQLPHLNGVTSEHSGSNQIRFEVVPGESTIAGLLYELSKHPVVTLSSHEPSLEEIFVHHYVQSDAAAGT